MTRRIARGHAPSTEAATRRVGAGRRALRLRRLPRPHPLQPRLAHGRGPLHPPRHRARPDPRRDHEPQQRRGRGRGARPGRRARRGGSAAQSSWARRSRAPTARSSGSSSTRRSRRGLSADATADAIHRPGRARLDPASVRPVPRARTSGRRRCSPSPTARQDRRDRGLQQPRHASPRHNEEAALVRLPLRDPRHRLLRRHSGLEVAMSFNALPAFETADELKARCARTSGTGAARPS